MMYSAKGLVALTTALLISNVCYGLVVEYQIGKARLYEQTTNNTAPTTPENYFFFSNLETDNDSDFSEVNLSGAPGGMVPYSEQNAGFSWDIYDEFTSELDLNSAYPDDGYEIRAMTTIGLIREDIALSGTFPTTIPYFTGTVADALQSIDTSQSFEFNWNAPALQENAFLSVEDITTGNEIFSVEPAFGVTNAVIPANTFEEGHEYIVSIVFFNAEEDTRESFSTGTGESVKGNVTQVSFFVAIVPEPEAMAFVFSALLALCFSLPRRKRAPTF